MTKHTTHEERESLSWYDRILQFVDAKYRPIVAVLITAILVGGGTFSAWAAAVHTGTEAMDRRIESHHDRVVAPVLAEHTRQISDLQAAEAETSKDFRAFQEQSARDVSEIKGDLRAMRQAVEDLREMEINRQRRR